MERGKIADNTQLFRYQRYLKKCRKQENISLEELFALYKNSSVEEKIKLRNRIVEYNMPLVVHFLWQRYNYSYDINPVFDLDDVIQEANLLLINAVDRYNQEKGSFATFLYIILHDVYYSHGIPNCPANINRTASIEYKKLKKYIDLGYDCEYIAETFGIELSKIQQLVPILSNSISYEQLLKRLIDKENSEEYSNLLYEDINLNRVLESCNIDVRNQAILNALNMLKPKYKNFMIKKFGLDGNGEASNSDLNKEIGGHKKYIYEVYKRAITRLLKKGNLEAVYNMVDTDYDYENKDKTYYLQK